MFFKTSILISLIILTLSAHADDFFKGEGGQLVKNFCYDCHDEDAKDGLIQFDNLQSLELDERLEVLDRLQEQIFIQEMPPRKKKKQPTEAERMRMLSWITGELKKHNASKLEEKLRKFEYANYVDHDKLFSGEYKNLPAFTADRRWLISEFIFDAKVKKLVGEKSLIKLNNKRISIIGGKVTRVNVTNPFLLPEKSGVRYYANETLHGGHLLTMITNAKEIASYMTSESTKNARYLPAAAKIMAQKNDHLKELQNRREFLENFIHEICTELYSDKNIGLLPKFQKVELPPRAESKDKNGKPIKKTAFNYANPGRDEMKIVYADIIKLRTKGMSDKKLIELLEKKWFYAGHNPRKITGRLVTMREYMTDINRNIKSILKKGNKYPEYKRPSGAEWKIYSEAIRKHRKPNDTYKDIIEKCVAEWEESFRQERIRTGPPANNLLRELIDDLFVKIFERKPSVEESDKYSALTSHYINEMGRLGAIEKIIQTLLLQSDFVYRYEFGQGDPDKYGRRMMSPRDAAYAISYALTDSSPDTELMKAVKSGKLNTREDYRREVTRILKKRDQYYFIQEELRKDHCDSITNMPIRELRFFREFFGYPFFMSIFKDKKRFGNNEYDHAKARLLEECDLLVKHILEKDKNVLKELLTTEKFYVYHSGDNQKIKEYSDRIRKIYDYFKDKGWQNVKTVKDLEPYAAFIKKMNMRGVDLKSKKDPVKPFKTAMTCFEERLGKGQKAAAPYNSFPAHGFANAMTRTGMKLRTPMVANLFNIDMKNWDYETTQPFKIPNRKGILTHPAWLMATAHNTETDPVNRGKWIREKLLAGTIPDVPITVDAVVPPDHTKTLRQRFDEKISDEYCWKCHERMNPIGNAFEMYDDFGRFRTEESLEYPENLIKKMPSKGSITDDLRDIYKALPVNAKGHLRGTGNPKLDGEVKDALDLIDRLAKSDRVRQSIIRHAFRYFMGRNEKLSDSKTLIDADQAYLKSGGSFDAVVISLLTSDSFIYRKAVKE